MLEKYAALFSELYCIQISNGLHQLTSIGEAHPDISHHAPKKRLLRHLLLHLILRVTRMTRRDLLGSSNVTILTLTIIYYFFALFVPNLLQQHLIECMRITFNSETISSPGRASSICFRVHKEISAAHLN